MIHNYVPVKFKRLHPLAQMPIYASQGAAGADLCAVERAFIQRGERRLIPTGVAIELPEGYEAQVRPRSGLAAKNGITVLNTPGTIDCDYRGEIKVILLNTGDIGFFIEPGTRIAQLVVAPVTRAQFTLVSELGDSLRGEKGFGSTGLS